MKIYDEEETVLSGRVRLAEEATLAADGGGAAGAPEISLFLPVLNEEPNLRPLHAKIDEALLHLGRTAEIIYVDDIVAGVRAALDYEASDYEVVNLGGSRTVSLSELIALLERELGREARIDRRPPQPGDVPQTYADVTKARRLLGYDPRTPIEEGIRRFVGWFRAGGGR